MTVLMMFLDAMGRSVPFAAGPPFWLVWCAFTCAHVLAGIIIAACPRRLWLPLCGALVAFETAVLLSAGEWSAMAWGAAVADLEAVAGGFLVARWRLSRETEHYTGSAPNQRPDPALALKE